MQEHLHTNTAQFTGYSIGMTAKRVHRSLLLATRAGKAIGKFGTFLFFPFLIFFLFSLFFSPSCMDKMNVVCLVCLLCLSGRLPKKKITTNVYAFGETLAERNPAGKSNIRFCSSITQSNFPSFKLSNTVHSELITNHSPSAFQVSHSLLMSIRLFAETF